MLDQAAHILEVHKLRKTAPRLAVIQVLLQAQSPLTQEQISVQLGDDAPNKTTIYRVLMSLVEKDLVHQAYVQDRTQHYELGHHCTDIQCHPHFTCTQCSRTHCLTETQIPIVKNLPDGFTLHRQKISLEGLCSDCEGMI